MSPLADGDPVRLGPFDVQGRLGSGGMGVVYGATDRNGQWLALKLIRAEYTDDVEFRDRFAREVALMSRVRARCIAPVLAAETREGQPWYATAYIPGPTLNARVKADGPLPLGHVEALAVGLAEAVAAIHAAGIVHRDLKPANVILAPDGPKVLDFGIARAVDESAITRTGGLVGSPGWMSPERFRGVTGPEADVFAWGAMVAYAVLGRPPFGTGGAETMMYRILHEEPDLTGLPGGLTEPVVRALDKDPARRPSAAYLIPLLTGGTDVLGPVDANEVAATLIKQKWTPVPQPAEPAALGTGRPHGGPTGPVGHPQGWRPGPAAVPPPFYGPQSFPTDTAPPKRGRAVLVTLASAFLVVVLLAGGTAWVAYRESAIGGPDDSDQASAGGEGLQGLADQGYVSVAYNEYAPLSFTDENGDTTGYSLEVTRAVFKELGVPDIKTESLPYEAMLPALSGDEFDVVSAGLTITPERCQRAAFADPDNMYTTAYMVKEGNPDHVTGSTEFNGAGRKLAVIHGSEEETNTRTGGGDSGNLEVVPDLNEGMEAVRSGKADAFAVDSMTARWQVKQDISKDLEVVSTSAPPVAEDGSQEIYAGMAFESDDTELINAVNKQLAKMRENGRLLEIGKEFGMSEHEIPDADITADSLCS